MIWIFTLTFFGAFAKGNSFIEASRVWIFWNYGETGAIPRWFIPIFIINSNKFIKIKFIFTRDLPLIHFEVFDWKIWINSWMVWFRRCGKSRWLLCKCILVFGNVVCLNRRWRFLHVDCNELVFDLHRKHILFPHSHNNLTRMLIKVKLFIHF